MWTDVTYEPGRVRAVAYREGEVIGEAAMVTAGAASEIRLAPDRTVLSADGMDLSYVLIEAFDRAGNPHPLADARVRISIDGPAHIAGVGNGNPQSFEPFRADYVDLFFGKAMLIVGAGQQAGRVTVRVTAEGLGSASTTIRIE
jgi:beta-galactosidase